MGRVLGKTLHSDYTECVHRMYVERRRNGLLRHNFARRHFQRRELCRSIGQLRLGTGKNEEKKRREKPTQEKPQNTRGFRTERIGTLIGTDRSHFNGVSRRTGRVGKIWKDLQNLSELEFRCVLRVSDYESYDILRHFCFCFCQASSAESREFVLHTNHVILVLNI